MSQMGLCTPQFEFTSTFRFENLNSQVLNLMTTTAILLRSKTWQYESSPDTQTKIINYAGPN